ncbi:hypothetical protein PQX77_014753 [Marasmius sp. AFHP31]|nr:hypothetical protein PQX77_014753 [Marasmius sp. AFHP31]
MPPADIDWSDDEEDWYRPASRGSNRSATSGLSSSSGSTASSSLISRSISITRSRRSSSLSEDSSNSSKPPLLRLALASFAQRSSTANKCYPSPASANSSDDEDSRFTLHATVSESPRDSFVTSPEFRIPSSTTLRLQKMDRIRKKLGDGVPVKLVFPDSDEEERQQSRPTESHTVIQLKTLPPLPPTLPTLRPRPSKSRRAGSRDSIVSTSAHRGQRVKRKPVPTLEQLAQSAPPSPARSSSKRGKARLSLILETPQDLDLFVASVIDSAPSSSSSSPASEWFDDQSEQWVDYKTFIRMAQDS